MIVLAGLALNSTDASGHHEADGLRPPFKSELANLMGDEAEVCTLTEVQIPNTSQHPGIMRSISNR
jgi:hypothetical protein